MIKAPSSDKSPILADWLEASLLRHPNRRYRITYESIIDVLEEDDFDNSDALLANLIQTVSTRMRIVGDGYPVQRDGLGFIRRGTWREYLPYSFMLLVSLNQAYAELRYTNGSANRPAEYFEHLTAIALERYLGCAVVRIGAPRRPPLPTQFPAALSYTIRQLNEALGRRDLEDQDSGDDGVDLIAWRAFNDSRPSQAILLAQCTIAVEWRDKRDGISLETWKRHIDWHSHPLKGFAVPFHHEQGNSWRETATRGGIIFDRLRIAKLAKGAPLKRQLRTDLEGWCRARINSLASLVIEGR